MGLADKDKLILHKVLSSYYPVILTILTTINRVHSHSVPFPPKLHWFDILWGGTNLFQNYSLSYWDLATEFKMCKMCQQIVMLQEKS